MIAIAIGLVALSTLLAGATVTCGVWLHSANADKEHLRDTLDSTRAASSEWEHKYNSEVVTHGACIKQREAERELRVIAESQRNSAQARVRELLKEHAKDATDDEINELLSVAFGPALGVVPPPVPKLSDDPTNGLLPLGS